ncbi:peptidase inhibitor family I36 protein [Micromonospora trifolii]|uniref:peptidase inhibitor family I36 protein n=1 Tax=Micromonospora trifolii TaxID=2911208 RepID=UPI003D2F0E6F
MTLKRRMITALCVAIALLIPGSPSMAKAEPAGMEITVTAAAAWDCPVGDLCIWSNDDGTGSRCNWANSDSDWRSTPVTCSWSATKPVKSMLNRGTSSSYAAVALYRNSGYGSLWGCLGQNGGNWTGLGVYLRSHRWVSNTCH